MPDYDVDRDDRSQDIVASAAQTVFGPLNFDLLDAVDLVIEKETATPGIYQTVSSAKSLSGVGPDLNPTVTFSVGRLAGEKLRFKSARLDARAGDVTQGGAVRSVPLERELQRFTKVGQEVRRDIDSVLDESRASSAALTAAIAAEAVTRANVDAAILSKTITGEGLLDGQGGPLADNPVFTLTGATDEEAARGTGGAKVVIASNRPAWLGAVKRLVSSGDEGTATLYRRVTGPVFGPLADGMVVAFKPHIDSGAAPRLIVNAEASEGLYLADGSVPEPAAFKQNIWYPLIFADGVFRQLDGGAALALSALQAAIAAIVTLPGVISADAEKIIVSTIGGPVPHHIARNLKDLGAVEGDLDANIPANHAARDAAIATGLPYEWPPGSLFKFGRGGVLGDYSGFLARGSTPAELLMGTAAGQFDADTLLSITDPRRYAFYAPEGTKKPMLENILFTMEANAAARTCFPVRFAGVDDGVMTRLTATGFKENDGGLFRCDSIDRGIFEHLLAIDCTHDNPAFATQVTALCIDGDRPNLAANPEFTTDTIWTKGAGWTIAAGKATHAAGSGTAALSQALGLRAGHYHTISMTISGRTAGSVTAKAGSGDSGLTFSANGAVGDLTLAAGDGVLSIVPTSNFDGSIEVIAVQRNSRAWEVRGVKAVNLRQGPAALAAHNDQSDCFNIQTLGDVCGARAFDIYGEDVGELIDCFASGLLIVGYTGRNITATPLKLVYGASNNRFVGGKVNGTGLGGAFISSTPASSPGTVNKPVSGNRIEVDIDNIGLLWSTYWQPVPIGMMAAVQVEAADDSNKPFDNHVTGRLAGDLAGTMATVFKEQRGTGIMARPNRVEVSFANNSDIAAIASSGKLGIFISTQKRVKINGTIPGITAAATINITDDDVETINVFGATNINFISASVAASYLWIGPIRKRLRFINGTTLIHNAQLLCPGGVNLVAAVASKVDLEEISFGVWEVMNYQT